MANVLVTALALEIMHIDTLYKADHIDAAEAVGRELSVYSVARRLEFNAEDIRLAAQELRDRDKARASN